MTISPEKIEKALARISNQRQTSHIAKIQKTIAEVEQNIKTNPLAVVEQFHKLEEIYAQASDEKKALYKDVREMLEEAIEECSTILIEGAKDIVKETPEG